MTQVDLAPSASFLVYLFPERVVQSQGHLPGSNAQVPGRDVKVNKRALASALMAVAFWDLRTLGLVDLAVVEGKVLFVKTAHVQVTLKQAAQRGGIENDILSMLQKQPSASTSALIRGWFGSYQPDPWGNVIHAVQREGIALGYLTPVHRGMLDMLKSKPEVEANTEAIVRAQPACDAVVAGWLRFKDGESVLATRLFKDCAEAIASRHEQQDDSDF